MKNKNYYSTGTLPQSNRKIIERCNIDNPNTGIYTSITGGGVKLVLWANEDIYWIGLRDFAMSLHRPLLVAH